MMIKNQIFKFCENCPAIAQQNLVTLYASDGGKRDRATLGDW
jgi:hypothetical protein